jgi:hypothetical protein
VNLSGAGEKSLEAGHYPDKSGLEFLKSGRFTRLVR